MGILDFFKKGAEKAKTASKPAPQPQPSGQKVGPNQNRPATSAQPGAPANKPAAPQAQPAAPQEDTYTVQSGDSLSKIAKRFYGDANLWRQIHMANADQIKDPNMIQPGWKLKIPRKK